MNKNQKEKPARIEIRASQKDKDRITKTASQCGLSVTEYMLQRALGYSPQMANPDAFYLFYGKLCELLNQPLSPDTEAAALQLFDQIHTEFLAHKRQPASEIRKDVAQWQQQASGPSKDV